MKKYLVGGAVRDILMGREPNDKDYVVVGETPESMEAKGFKRVGKSFPVFLHPETGEEYALARTERSTGQGHGAFECEWEGVTLEQDLSRRDLTINAMAMDDEGNVIDPFGGQQDIESRTLRHVSEAFSEDPLRVLRVARFASQLGDTWVTEDSTEELCVDMWREGMLDYLTPERVWGEVHKALKGECPSMFFWELRGMLFEEVDMMLGIEQPPQHHPEGDVYRHTMRCIDYAAKRYRDPLVTFAALCHDFGKASCYAEHGNFHGHEELGADIVYDFCNKWRVPNRYRLIAMQASRYHTHIHRGWSMSAKKILEVVKKLRANQDVEMFESVLKVSEADSRSRGGKFDVEYTQASFWREVAKALKSVDLKTEPEYIKATPKGKVHAIRRIQLRTVENVKKEFEAKKQTAQLRG